MRKDEIAAIIRIVADARQVKAADAAIAADLVRLGIPDGDTPAVMELVTHGLKHGVSLGFTEREHQPGPDESPLYLAAIVEGRRRFKRASTCGGFLSAKAVYLGTFATVIIIGTTFQVFPFTRSWDFWYSRREGFIWAVLLHWAWLVFLTHVVCWAASKQRGAAKVLLMLGGSLLITGTGYAWTRVIPIDLDHFPLMPFMFAGAVGGIVTIFSAMTGRRAGEYLGCAERL